MIESSKNLLHDFALEIATANGSGSQTANHVLLRSLLRSGHFASGKNIFPSNISGLPTWFQIRINAKGYEGRKGDTDLMVCLNPESLEADLQKLKAGAICLLDETLKPKQTTAHLRLIHVPLGQLAAQIEADPKLLRLLKNMVYVGVLAYLLHLESETINTSIAGQLKGKPKAIDLNLQAGRLGYQWAEAHLNPAMRVAFPKQADLSQHILLEGNKACALGAIFAGVTVAAWYPITPSTSVLEYLAEYAKSLRSTADGKSNVAIIQMEDELAAAGAVMGAGWAGARAMTATSGPGISLMSEMLGLGYFAEIPGVFIDVARMGPSTGLPTRTSQGDIEICAKASHGDTLHICLYPGTMEECFRFTYDAFDLAERFQTPVLVVMDLDLGMQPHTCRPFSYPESPLDRGKVLGQSQLAEIEHFARYKDVDGDGIPYRTLPGTPGGKGAYFTRGTGHTDDARYSENPQNYQANLDRLKRKWENAAQVLPKTLIEDHQSQAGLIAYGSSQAALKEALDLLAASGQPVDTCRLRAFPFGPDVKAFLEGHDAIFVVEQNRDGQMSQLLRSSFPQSASKIQSLCHYDGQVLSAKDILDSLQSLEK